MIFRGDNGIVVLAFLLFLFCFKSLVEIDILRYLWMMSRICLKFIQMGAQRGQSGNEIGHELTTVAAG